jgi:hypothetical protein
MTEPKNPDASPMLGSTMPRGWLIFAVALYLLLIVGLAAEGEMWAAIAIGAFLAFTLYMAGRERTQADSSEIRSQSRDK